MFLSNRIPELNYYAKFAVCGVSPVAEDALVELPHLRLRADLPDDSSIYPWSIGEHYLTREYLHHVTCTRHQASESAVPQDLPVGLRT